MRLSSSRPGEANVPAVLLSTAVLILAIAAAFYVMVVLPFQNDDDASGSSSSSSVSSMMSSSQNVAPASAAPSSAFNQAAYDGCINAATEAHTQRWAAACLQLRETQESAYLACIQQEKGETYCQAQFGGYEEIDPNCVLSPARTAALNAQFTLGKEVCDREHGQ